MSLLPSVVVGLGATHQSSLWINALEFSLQETVEVYVI